MFIFYDFSERRIPTGGRKETTHRVHQVPGTGAGERVSLQQIPDPETEDRDRSFAGAVGTADQDMVPEPADEIQEGQPSAQHEECAPEKRKRATGGQKVAVQKQQQQQQQYWQQQ